MAAITASTAGATYATFFAIARRETDISVSLFGVVGFSAMALLYARSRQRARVLGALGKISRTHPDLSLETAAPPLAMTGE